VGIGQKNPTPIPSVVRNPTPTPPKNLRLLTTPTPQPCTSPWLEFRYCIYSTTSKRYSCLSWIQITR